MQAYFMTPSWPGLRLAAETGSALLSAPAPWFSQNFWFMGLSLFFVALSFYGRHRRRFRRLRAEHRKLVKALRASEEKFKNVFEHAGTGLARVGLDGHWLQVNPALCRMLGYSAAELLKTDFQAVTDLQPNLNLLQDALACGNNSYTMEKRYIHKLGHAVRAQLNVAIVREAHGRPSHLIAHIHDITAGKRTEEMMQENESRDISGRKKAERALSESNQRLRRQYSTLAELIHSKVFQDGEQPAALQEITAAAARCLGANRVGVWFYDEARVKIICQNLYELSATHHSQGQEFLCTDYPSYFKALLEERYLKADQAQRDPRTSEFAAAYLTPNGITSLLDVPIQVGGRPVGVVRHEHVGPPRHWRLDEQVFTGAVADLIALLVESREHRQSEEKFRRLENLVEERTKRIRELERHRAENEKLAATGRMAARIAHEINNPLAGIKNSFRLIKKAVPVTHTHYEYAGLIESEIDRIADIVRQMFDLYRPDYEAVRNFPADFAIRDVVTLLKGSCRERRVTVEVEINTARLTVALSENSLRQVLYNVIQNAIDASPPEGTIKITVDLEQDGLAIRVADRGNGIPEEIRPRIFEPFFTTKSGYSRSGLGLGLSVSKSLIEAMHGTLGYETVVGKGTTFRIVLPLAGGREHRDIFSPAVASPALAEQT